MVFGVVLVCWENGVGCCLVYGGRENGIREKNQEGQARSGGRGYLILGLGVALGYYYKYF
jgi:hypothetical protein